MGSKHMKRCSPPWQARKCKFKGERSPYHTQHFGGNQFLIVPSVGEDAGESTLLCAPGERGGIWEATWQFLRSYLFI